MNRREKLFLLWTLASTGIAVVLVGIIIRLALPHTPSRIFVGNVDDFAPDSTTDVTLPFEITDPRSFDTISRLWIARDANGKFTALIGRNAKIIEPVIWQSVTQRFEAPVTGAKWDRNGKYLLDDPRLGVDLDQFPVVVNNGQVVVELKVIPGTPLP